MRARPGNIFLFREADARRASAIRKALTAFKKDMAHFLALEEDPLVFAFGSVCYAERWNDVDLFFFFQHACNIAFSIPCPSFFDAVLISEDVFRRYLTARNEKGAFLRNVFVMPKIHISGSLALLQTLARQAQEHFCPFDAQQYLQHALQKQNLYLGHIPRSILARISH